MRRKFLNLDSLKCHFPDFGERFYRILIVKKWHCCSIGYSLRAPIGVGGRLLARVLKEGVQFCYIDTSTVERGGGGGGRENVPLENL